jgi:hypothetical protein
LACKKIVIKTWKSNLQFGLLAIFFLNEGILCTASPLMMRILIKFSFKKLASDKVAQNEDAARLDGFPL